MDLLANSSGRPAAAVLAAATVPVVNKVLFFFTRWLLVIMQRAVGSLRGISVFHFMLSWLEKSLSVFVYGQKCICTSVIYNEYNLKPENPDKNIFRLFIHPKKKRPGVF